MLRALERWLRSSCKLFSGAANISFRWCINHPKMFKFVFAWNEKDGEWPPSQEQCSIRTSRKTKTETEKNFVVIPPQVRLHRSCHFLLFLFFSSSSDSDSLLSFKKKKLVDKKFRLAVAWIFRFWEQAHGHLAPFHRFHQIWLRNSERIPEENERRPSSVRLEGTHAPPGFSPHSNLLDTWWKLHTVSLATVCRSNGTGLSRYPTRTRFAGNHPKHLPGYATVSLQRAHRSWVYRGVHTLHCNWRIVLRERRFPVRGPFCRLCTWDRSRALLEIVTRT